MKYVMDGFVSLTDTFIFFLFLNVFMKQRRNNKIINILSFITIMAIHIISSFYINGSFPIKFVMFIILDIVFCWILFVDTWYKYILITALFYILIAIVEFMTASFLGQFAPNFDTLNVYDLYTPQTYAIILIIRLLELAIIMMIRTFKNRPIYRKQWRGLLLMPVITVVFFWMIYPRYWAMHNKNIDNLLLALAVFLVIQNLLVFAYIAAMQSSTERYFEMKTAYDRQTQYFSTVTTIQKAIRKMAHDIRHHFIYLMSALEQEDIPKAKSYLIELDESLDNMVSLDITGHCDIDALLHAKARLADRLGVHIRLEGKLPPEIMISPIDLSVLLGNSIDNAIEAASKVEGEKEIAISFVYNASRLSFTISNPYTGQIQKKQNGYFISQKINGGLGVEIIDQVVKKYNGVLFTDFNDNKFTLTTMLQTRYGDKQEIESTISKECDNNHEFI